MILGCIKCAFVIADTQLPYIALRVPIEWQILDRGILAVGAVDCCKHGRAVFHASTHRSEFVHAPGERHRAGAGDAAERGSQAGRAVARGWRNNGAKRFAANAEANQPGHGRRTWSCRGAARSLVKLPWISRSAAVPHITLGEGA